MTQLKNKMSMKEGNRRSSKHSKGDEAGNYGQEGH